MDRLTPELWAHSTFDGTATGVETRELDFNLARRSAVVINHILGQISMYPTTTSGFEVDAIAIQELDTDPDNVTTEFGGDTTPDGVVLDSSRPFRQAVHYGWDTAAGAVRNFNQILQRDWTKVDDVRKPISITSLRHHLNIVAGIASTYRVELHISYFIVELTFLELGIINASRR